MAKELGFKKDWQFYRFCSYGFLKNQRFFEPFFMLFLLQKLLGNYTQVMFLYSLKFAVRAILEIPSGVVADALGRRSSLLFSYLLYIASFIVYYFSDTFYALFIPSIIFGVGDAFRTGSHKAMIIEYLNLKKWTKARTSYYGHTRSWSQYGSAISAVIAAVLMIFSENYDKIFLFTAIPYIIGSILLITYPKELDGKLDDQGSLFENIKYAFYGSYKQLFNFKTLKRLSFVTYFEGFHFAMKDFVQPIMVTAVMALPIGLLYDTKDRTAISLGLIYFVLHMFSALSSRKSSSYPNPSGITGVAINQLNILGAITGIGIAALYLFDLPLMSGIMFIPLYIFLNMQKPFTVTYISEKFTPTFLATVLSIESQIVSIIGAIIAFVLGLLTQKYNIGIAIGVVSFVLFIISVVESFFRKIKDEENK
ncbi:MAG: MFS transporter [Bacteroidales bacterium]|nr:MFS transporter [Bacteroidales bacterium]MBN2819412.1 MFS transporter [Bacteroidales bacterium]